MDALRILQEAHNSIHDVMSSHQHTAGLQRILCNILDLKGRIYNGQYRALMIIASQNMIAEGKSSIEVPDQTLCRDALAVLEQALAINRSLNSQAGEMLLDHTRDDSKHHGKDLAMLADTLFDLACTHKHLEMYDTARVYLKEALELTRHCYGNVSREIVDCYHELSLLGSKQVVCVSVCLRATLCACACACVCVHVRVRLLLCCIDPKADCMAIGGLLLPCNVLQNSRLALSQ